MVDQLGTIFMAFRRLKAVSNRRAGGLPPILRRQQVSQESLAGLPKTRTFWDSLGLG